MRDLVCLCLFFILMCKVSLVGQSDSTFFNSNLELNDSILHDLKLNDLKLEGITTVENGIRTVHFANDSIIFSLSRNRLLSQIKNTYYRTAMVVVDSLEDETYMVSAGEEGALLVRDASEDETVIPTQVWGLDEIGQLIWNNGSLTKDSIGRYLTIVGFDTISSPFGSYEAAIIKSRAAGDLFYFDLFDDESDSIRVNEIKQLYLRGLAGDGITTDWTNDTLFTSLDEYVTASNMVTVDSTLQLLKDSINVASTSVDSFYVYDNSGDKITIANNDTLEIVSLVSSPIITNVQNGDSLVISLDQLTLVNNLTQTTNLKNILRDSININPTWSIDSVGRVFTVTNSEGQSFTFEDQAGTISFPVEFNNSGSNGQFTGSTLFLQTFSDDLTSSGQSPGGTPSNNRVWRANTADNRIWFYDRTDPEWVEVLTNLYFEVTDSTTSNKTRTIVKGGDTIGVVHNPLSSGLYSMIRGNEGSRAVMRGFRVEGSNDAMSQKISPEFDMEISFEISNAPLVTENTIDSTWQLLVENPNSEGESRLSIGDLRAELAVSESTIVLNAGTSVTMNLRYSGGGTPTFVGNATTGNYTLTLPSGVVSKGFYMNVFDADLADSNDNFSLNVVSADGEEHFFSTQQFLLSDGRRLSDSYNISPKQTQTSNGTIQCTYSNMNLGGIRIVGNFW